MAAMPADCRARGGSRGGTISPEGATNEGRPLGFVLDQPFSLPALTSVQTFVMRWRMVTTCDFCGSSVDDDAPPVTWTTSVEHGRLRWFCDDCSRQHLRSMESKLDSEWW